MQIQRGEHSSFCQVYRKWGNGCELFDNDCKNGIKPFLLVDGHQSKFDVEFLRYVNDPETEWVVAIGVPYSTALWQVADSAEQNGKFKMKLTEEKKKLFDEQMGSFQQDLQLLKTNILPLVCLAWPEAFTDIPRNLRAILKCGFNPLNRNLLLNDMIRATMTTAMMEEERKKGLYPYERVPITSTNTGSLLRPHQQSSNRSSLNFSSGGMAQYVANTIIGEVEKQAARDRILARKTAAKSERDRIMSITKKMTAGKLVLEGRCFHLNRNVLDQSEKRHKTKQAEIESKVRINEMAYIELCKKADNAKDRNKNESDPSKWPNYKDILTYIKPLKRSGDKPLPTRREDIIKRYHQYKNHKQKEVNAIILADYEDMVVEINNCAKDPEVEKDQLNTDTLKSTENDSHSSEEDDM